MKIAVVPLARSCSFIFCYHNFTKYKDPEKVFDSRSNLELRLIRESVPLF